MNKQLLKQYNKYIDNDSASIIQSELGPIAFFTMKYKNGYGTSVAINRIYFENYFSQYFSKYNLNINDTNDSNHYIRNNIINKEIPRKKIQQFLSQFFQRYNTHNDYDNPYALGYWMTQHGDFDELENTQNRCYIWDLSDLNVPESFNYKNIILMGDAAHCTLPYCGCGAGTGFTDALIFTRLMKQYFINNDNDTSCSDNKINQHAYVQLQSKHTQIIQTCQSYNKIRYLHDKWTNNDELFKFLVPILPNAIFNKSTNVFNHLFIEEENIKPLNDSWTKPIAYASCFCLIICSSTVYLRHLIRNRKLVDTNIKNSA